MVQNETSAALFIERKSLIYFRIAPNYSKGREKKDNLDVAVALVIGRSGKQVFSIALFPNETLGTFKDHSGKERLLFEISIRGRCYMFRHSF